MGIRPRTHWSGWSFIRSRSKPWRCRQGTWRAWVPTRAILAWSPRADQPLVLFVYVFMKTVKMRNAFLCAEFSNFITTPEGLRITPSDTTKVMERIAKRKIWKWRKKRLTFIIYVRENTLEQGEIFMNPVIYFELFNRSSISQLWWKDDFRSNHFFNCLLLVWNDCPCLGLQERPFRNV